MNTLYVALEKCQPKCIQVKCMISVQHLKVAFKKTFSGFPKHSHCHLFSGQQDPNIGSAISTGCLAGMLRQFLGKQRVAYCMLFLHINLRQQNTCKKNTYYL